jgi:hypothetical protein
MSAAACDYLSNQLTGIAIEQIFLCQLPPDVPLDWLGQSPTDRRAELQQQREQIRTLITTVTPICLAQLTDAELIDYYDRWKQSGEIEAMKRLASRIPAQQQTTPQNRHRCQGRVATAHAPAAASRIPKAWQRSPSAAIFITLLRETQYVRLWGDT